MQLIRIGTSVFGYWVASYGLHAVIERALLLVAAVGSNNEALHRLPPRSLNTVVQHLHGCVAYPVLVAMYTLGKDSAPSVSARWAQPASMDALCLSIALSLYDLGIMRRDGPLLRDRASCQVFAHHMLLTLNAALLLLTRRGGFWAASLSWIELTNVPLGCVRIMQELGVRDRYRHGTVAFAAYTASGALLWLSFLRLRVCGIWSVLRQMLDDLFADPSRARMLAVEEGEGLNRLAVSFVVGGTFCAWVLSCLWFVPITRGIVRVMCSAAPYRQRSP